MLVAEIPAIVERNQAHEDLIARFYTAFGRRDAAEMARCYHKEVRFSDPVFQDLQGERASGMWRMLCVRGKDLEITFGAIEAGDRYGRAHWDASYSFSLTGRKVLNRIDARFEFKDGLIWRHQDTFDLWKWSTMAFGPLGQVLGWTPFFTGKLRQESLTALDKFVVEETLAGP